VTLFAGEAEGRLAGLFADALAGRLQPIYNFMADLPGLQQQVTPFLPLDIVRRYGETIGAFRRRARLPVSVPAFVRSSMSRGVSRVWRDADDVERLVRANLAQGVFRFFITDDNFCAQPQLGGDLRPADRDARARRARAAVHHPGRPRSATASRTLSRRRRAPAASGSLSGSKTSTPTVCCRPRRSRTGCTNTARCFSPGAPSGSSPMPATFWGFRATPPERIARDIRTGAAGTAGRSAGILYPDAAAGARPTIRRLTRTGCGWTPT